MKQEVVATVVHTVRSTWNFSSWMTAPAWPHPRNNFLTNGHSSPFWQGETAPKITFCSIAPESAAGVLPNKLHPIKIKVIFFLLCIQSVFFLYHFIFVSSFPATSPVCIHKNVWRLSVSWFAFEGHWSWLVFLRIWHDHLFTNTKEKFFRKCNMQKMQLSRLH